MKVEIKFGLIPRLVAIASSVSLVACGDDDPEEREPDVSTDVSDVDAADGDDSDGDISDNEVTDIDVSETDTVEEVSDTSDVEETGEVEEDADTDVEPEKTCETVCTDLSECASTCDEATIAALNTACVTACEADQAYVYGLFEIECAEAGRILADSFGAGSSCFVAECPVLATDYTPGADDDYAACISDDNTYHPVDANISSIARVDAFETIADLLWRNGTPAGDAFISALESYALSEGIESRVTRREDEHYPPVLAEDGVTTLRCRDAGVPELDPDRCVGPAKIAPLLNDAFERGATGDMPLVQAARIEAGLLWFFYVSTHKEAKTCGATPVDCDSSYAYYGGGVGRDGGRGLAGEILRLSAFSHDRVWDGLLGVRCWRDLATGDASTDPQLHVNAIAQLDRGLLRGVARLVQERVLQAVDHTGEALEADWAYIEILAGVLDREARARDAAAADALAAAVAARESGTIVETLGAVFECP